jgi:glycerophosphoryl diester phosphodiesterase
MRVTTLIFLCLIMINDTDATEHIDVQGHRGARAVLPENTMIAFEYALELGVDTLEFDMGVSKDGEVVVTHDQKINPVICQTKNGESIEEGLWVHQLSLAEIKQFDCGSKVNPRFGDQKMVPGSEIPTLREVFTMVNESKLANAKTIMFNIETKSDPLIPDAQPEPDVFVSAVYEVIKDFGFEHRVTLQSFDHRTLLSAARLAPDLQRSALFKDAPDDWLEAALAADAHIISPHHQIIDRKSVTAMQDEGLAVIPWTANSKRQWARLLKLGVDGIITDDPKALMVYLERL